VFTYAQHPGCLSPLALALQFLAGRRVHDADDARRPAVGSVVLVPRVSAYRALRLTLMGAYDARLSQGVATRL
jgi:hypothetical protein